jgi:hypothetical protein
MISDFFQVKSVYLSVSLIFLTGVILYLPSLSVEFIADEIAFISRNDPGELQNLPGLLDKKDYDGDYYRPAGNFISGVLTLAVGYNPVYYRLFNLLLNSLNGLLVFLFLLELLKQHERKGIIAFFGALFFISFPLNDYAVIWHPDLFDRVMMSFYFLSLIYFLKNKIVLSLVFFLLSVLSKEMAFSLPVIIVLLSYNTTRKFAESIKASLPYFIILLLLFFFRWIVFNNNLLDLQDAHAGGTIPDMVKNLFLFQGMLVFPFFLRETEMLLRAYPTAAIFLAGTIGLASAYYIFKHRRSDILFWFLLLFIIISILPASRLLMRWYLYLPSAVFASLLAYTIFTLRFSIRTAVICAALIFSLYYGYTLYRQTVWIDVSVSGKDAVTALLNEYKEELAENQELIFLTIPAKVNDIPLFQLAFDHHLNYYLKGNRSVNVLTRSYLSDIEDEIEVIPLRDGYSISHTGDNYFMLSGNEKNVKFINDQTIFYSEDKEPQKNIFTFSKGKFQLIKE